MRVLKAHRANLIAWGRYFAGQIARAHGTVHTRQVRQSLESAKLVDPTSTSEFWLGAIFNKADWFEWTGQYHTYSDAERNVHERTVKVWRLRDSSLVPPQPETRHVLADGDQLRMF